MNLGPPSDVPARTRSTLEVAFDVVIAIAPLAGLIFAVRAEYEARAVQRTA